MVQYKKLLVVVMIVGVIFMLGSVYFAVVNSSNDTLAKPLYQGVNKIGSPASSDSVHSNVINLFENRKAGPMSVTKGRYTDNNIKTLQGPSTYNYYFVVNETGFNFSILSSWYVFIKFTDQALHYISYATSYSTSTSDNVSLSLPFSGVGVSANLSFGFQTSYGSEAVNSLNRTLTLVSSKNTYYVNISFPELYSDSITFANYGGVNPIVFSFENSNITANLYTFTNSLTVYASYGTYSEMASYNFSHIYKSIKIDSNTSQSLSFSLYLLSITLITNYSLNNDGMFITNESSSSITIESLDMVLVGNTFTARIGNGSYIIIFGINTGPNDNNDINDTTYVLFPKLNINASPEILSVNAPSFSIYHLTFSGLSSYYSGEVAIEQPRVFGSYLVDKISSNGIQGNITLLTGKALLLVELDYNNSFAYSFSYLVNSSSGHSINVGFRAVSVTDSNTMPGSTFLYCIGEYSPADSLLQSIGQTEGSDHPLSMHTVMVPNLTLEIQGLDELTNQFYAVQYETLNLTPSMNSVSFTFVQEYLVHTSVSNVPSNFTYSMYDSGHINGVYFDSSSSNFSYIYLPGGEQLIELQLITSNFEQYFLHYVSIDVSSNASSNNFNIPFPAVIYYNLTLANPLYGIQSQPDTVYAVEFDAVNENLTGFSSITGNLSNLTVSEVSVQSSGKYVNISGILPAGSYHEYLILGNEYFNFESPTVFLNDLIINVGSISVSSSGTVNHVVIPSIKLAKITFNSNFIYEVSSDALISSTDSNTFGLSEFSHLGFSNVTEYFLAPVSVNLDFQIAPLTSGIVVTPSSESSVISSSTQYQFTFSFSSVIISKYSVIFAETGLKSGTSWSVTFNGTEENSTSDIITYSVTNGTYSYTVASISGYTVSPSSGSITVNGKNYTQSVTFTAISHPVTKYTVTFKESGLPSGTSWSVTFNGSMSVSSNSSIAYTVPNGTYSYSIGSVSGYTVSKSSGSVTVNGSNVTVNVTFSKSTSVTQPSKSPLSGTTLYIIIGVVVAVVAVAGGLAAFRRKP